MLLSALCSVLLGLATGELEMHQRTRRCVLKDNASVLSGGRRHLEEKMAQADRLSKGLPPSAGCSSTPRNSSSSSSSLAFQKVVVVNPRGPDNGWRVSSAFDWFHTFICMQTGIPKRKIYLHDNIKRNVSVC